MKPLSARARKWAQNDLNTKHELLTHASRDLVGALADNNARGAYSLGKRIATLEEDIRRLEKRLAQPELPALTPAQRSALDACRRAYYVGYNLAPGQGFCLHCGGDLIEHYREEWITADISGCPLCSRSFCE